jgi:hypothetical protein
MANEDAIMTELTLDERVRQVMEATGIGGAGKAAEIVIRKNIDKYETAAAQATGQDVGKAKSPFAGIEELQRQIFEETRPAREVGLEQIERFRAQQPGTTEFFRQGLQRGTTALQQRAAGFGLTDSSIARRGFTDLGARLLGEEEAIRQQGLLSGAQLATTGFGQTANLASQQAAGLAQLNAARYGQQQQAPQQGGFDPFSLALTGLSIYSGLGGFSGGAGAKGLTSVEI